MAPNPGSRPDGRVVVSQQTRKNTKAAVHFALDQKKKKKESELDEHLKKILVLANVALKRFCVHELGLGLAWLLLMLRAADSTRISLVWSSQIEPEHDLFPGEMVCFLCPASAQRATLFLSSYPTLTPHSRFWVTWPIRAQNSQATFFFF